MTRTHALLFAAFGAFASSCYTSSPLEIGPSPSPLVGNPRQVQVTRKDGTSVTLMHPVMSADSLVGSTYVRGQGNVRVAIPGSDVKNLQTSTFSGTRTVGLILGIVAAAAVLLYIALANSTLDACNPATCSP